MATRRFEVNPGETLTQVTESVGAATVNKAVELTVDLAALVPDGNAPGGVRPITRNEVLLAIEYFENYITQIQWPRYNFDSFVQRT